MESLFLDEKTRKKIFFLNIDSVGLRNQDTNKAFYFKPKLTYFMKWSPLLLLACMAIFYSCGKTNDTSAGELPSKAETKPQFDNTTFGVYKGVIIGSSGYIVFRINNGDGDVKGFLTIDGKKDVLTTNQAITAGQPIVNVKFKGSFSSMTLNAENNGNDASLSDIRIDGHPGKVTSILFHEKSTQQVFSYEGKISGTLSGTINLNRITGVDTTFSLMKFDTDTTVYWGLGFPLSGDSVELSFWSGYILYCHFKGKWGNNNISGTWSDNNANSGTFSGERSY